MQQSATDGRKTVSALKAEFETTAERWGRDRQLAGAMVDADVVVEGLSKGKILTLSAHDALEWGMADYVAESRHELLTSGLSQLRGSGAHTALGRADRTLPDQLHHKFTSLDFGFSRPNL